VENCREPWAVCCCFAQPPMRMTATELLLSVTTFSFTSSCTLWPRYVPKGNLEVARKNLDKKRGPRFARLRLTKGPRDAPYCYGGKTRWDGKALSKRVSSRGPAG